MIDWKAINWGSVADWVSGIGSFSAAMVALYVAKSALRIRLNGYCGHRLVVGGGEDPFEVFSLSVTNMSQRPTVIRMIGIRCGVLRWKRQGIIAFMKSHISHEIPKALADGETGTWSVEIGEDHNWLRDLVEKFEMDWFAVNTLKFSIHTSNGGVTFMRPEREFKRMLLEQVAKRKHG